MIRYKALVIVFILATWSEVESYAQSFNVNLSPSHQQKLLNTKDYKKKLTKYKKYAVKDSLKQTKAMLKAYEYKLDSLGKADELRREIYEDIAEVQSELLPDTSNVSLDYLKQVASEDEQYQEQLLQLEALETQYGDLLSFRDSLLYAPQHWDSLLLQQDSAALAYVSQQGRSMLMESGGEELGALAGLPQFGASDVVPDHTYAKQQVGAAQALTGEMLEEKDYQAKAQSLVTDFSEQQLVQLRETQAKMKLDKLKYAEIGDSNDMTTAKKHSSLKGVSASKRISLGGNFNITSTDPVIFDLTPQVGYYINRKWSAGLGFTYRDSFGDSPNSQLPDHGYGVSTFMTYDIYKSLFVYGEYGQLKNDHLFGEKEASATWNTVGLIGLGINIRVSTKVDGQLMLLYDTQKNSPQQIFGQPVVIKFGFKLSELGRAKLFD